MPAPAPQAVWISSSPGPAIQPWTSTPRFEQEYFAIRNTCSVYDLTPMVKYRITGADAERYLNRLVTRDVRKLKPNRVAYTVWLQRCRPCHR
ncbi:MAG: hypothetical protein WDN04_07725 [Rhodospirillales bacterium]